METDDRVEFAGVAIAAVVIGIGALLFIAADAGVWAWLVLGLGLILASVIVVRAMARRNRRPALAAVPPPVAVAPLDGRFRLLVIADDSCTSAAFRDNVVGHAAGRSTEVLVLAPALGSRLARWTGDESAYGDAQTHLDETLRALTDLGIEARGRIGPHDPLQAAERRSSRVRRR